MKLKKGDLVEVLAGKNKGKKGIIEKILSKAAFAKVAGVNIYKKHQKPKPGKRGGIVEIAKPLPIAALALVCPKCEKVTRIGFKFASSGKFRICKKCGEQI